MGGAGRGKDVEAVTSSGPVNSLGVEENAAQPSQSQSTAKQKPSATRTKRKPWAYLWSLDYSLESTGRAE
jgi:hypothetical protein